MYQSTANSSYDYILICCSFNAYNYILNFDFNIDNIFGCLNDLSYGDLNLDKFTFISGTHKIELNDMLNRIDINTKVNILFNSNNSCEYCNLLYILRHFYNYDISLIDTGRSFKTDYGILTINRSDMISINMIDTYMKSKYHLSKELLSKYQEEWNNILFLNSELRYIKNKVLYSVDKNFFDKKIKNQNFYTILDDYGLSEKWLIKRYNYLNKKIMLSYR